MKTEKSPDPSIEQVRAQFMLAEQLERKHEETLGTVRTLKRTLAISLIRAQHGAVSVHDMERLLKSMGCR